MLLKKIFLLSSFLILCACGFQLRGPSHLPNAFQTLYLKSSEPYGPLTKELTQYLKMSGVTLTKTPHDAKIVLAILSEEKSQQLISVNGTQQARQYNLTLTVTFELTSPEGKLLLPPQIVS